MQHNGLKGEDWLNSPFRNINYFRVSAGAESSIDNLQEDYRNYIINTTFIAPSAGFYPDYRTMEADIEKRVELYRNLITYAFTGGTFDPAQIDSVVQQLAEAGTDAVVAEVQRQLDQWRSK